MAMGGQKPARMEISRVVGLLGPQRACWLVLAGLFSWAVSPVAAAALCVCVSGGLSRTVFAVFSFWLVRLASRLFGKV